MLAYIQTKFASASKIFFFVTFIFLMLSTQAYAQNIDLTNVTLDSVLKNIAATIPNLMRMVTAIAYVLGILFIVRGIAQLKHAGESRTMMSHEHHLSGPIIQITVGALLIYLPSAVQVGMSTFWTNPNPYGYSEDQSQGQWSKMIGIAYLIVQFVGTIAFIRGLIILSHSGGGHGQQGSVSRGLTHIIGGILCINVYQLIQVIFNTIGVSSK